MITFTVEAIEDTLKTEDPSGDYSEALRVLKKYEARILLEIKVNQDKKNKKINLNKADCLAMWSKLGVIETHGAKINSITYASQSRGYFNRKESGYFTCPFEFFDYENGIISYGFNGARYFDQIYIFKGAISHKTVIGKKMIAALLKFAKENKDEIIRRHNESDSNFKLH